MNTHIAERLSALRAAMKKEKIAAFVFPSTDPHNGEYIPDYWKGRQWISGFNGSAGLAVVTLSHAALWTDSRYFIAAEEQLAGTEFVLMKMKMPQTPSPAQWLASILRDTDTTEVAIDGWVVAQAWAKDFAEELKREGGLTLRTNFDPLKEIWTDRPALPLDPVKIHPLAWAGERTADKLMRIRQALKKQHADGTVVATLDDIAWTLNLRGNDVHCNPVFVAYLIITEQKATLYIDSRKITPEVQQYLKSEGVDVDEYAHFAKAVQQYDEYNILLDPQRINNAIFRLIKKPVIVYGTLPVPAMKAVKNDAEIKGFDQAMLRDGVALVKFLMWLKPAVEAGGQTEMTVSDKLESLRKEQAHYQGCSFDTIAGYEAHGAIVHYEASKDTDAELKPQGLLLLDSGAQYLDGTTDITRTIPLGPLTDEQRRLYTLVLKGHIQLELAKFPEGTTGTQLDILARKALWNEGLNYLHGTGHGVGAYLNVHEGPHQIRMEWMSTPLSPGMTVTDEPGIYLEGKFGVRIENTLIVEPYCQTVFGNFYQFRSLTLCPIDLEPVVLDLLDEEEIQWLNQYHEEVYHKLSPQLNEVECNWLKNATKKIHK